MGNKNQCATLWVFSGKELYGVVARRGLSYPAASGEEMQ